MKYTEYEEVPLLLFLKIARDESKVHLLKGDSKASNKKCRKKWAKFRDKWDEKHPSSKWVRQRALYKKCLLANTRLNKYKFFLSYIDSFEIVPGEDVFKEAGIPYSEDFKETVKKVKNLIDKESDKLLMANASLKKLNEELEEEEILEEEENNLHEIIASLELATGQTYDYSKITIGEYEGRQKALERKNRILESQYKNNGSKR